MVHPERIHALNDAEPRDGRYVLYWMQASQRADSNHALEHAIRRADEQKLPVLACFGLTDDYPEANERHYAFMLEGLAETEASLAQRGIRLVVRIGHPPDVAAGLAAEAARVVCDVGYLRHQRAWRRHLAKAVACPVVAVETDVVVPVREASDKAEYAARTIRPKLHRQWDRYLVPLEQTRPKRDSLELKLPEARSGTLGSPRRASRTARGQATRVPPTAGRAGDDLRRLLPELDLDRSVPPTGRFHGGTSRARGLLGAFIADKLNRYDAERSDPSLAIESHMSPYLHFGQISPLEVALRVRDADGASEECKADYLEQLIVRRELAINFCYYNPLYDSLKCLPEWAQESLEEHADDEREYTYAEEEFESARTHDPYWNAAQRQMVATGKMHNYMRMYWSKKILEWSARPEDAWRVALRLNNTYELDGRDANGYTGVAWCFGKHDQGWAERKVLGKVRYMSAGGLERKFDIDAYVEQVDEIWRRNGA